MKAQNKSVYSNKPSLSRLFLGTAKPYDISGVRRQPDKYKHFTAYSVCDRPLVCSDNCDSKKEPRERMTVFWRQEFSI